MIKAIETDYNGYRFRSRLEARWAVFFDALGIRYQYELQGFDLADLGYYLPDFYLPSLNMWLEIKPAIPSWEEIAKIISVSIETESCGYVLFGDPGFPLIKVSADTSKWELHRGACALGQGKVVQFGDLPYAFWVEQTLRAWRIDTCLELWPFYGPEFKVDGPEEIYLLGTDGKKTSLSIGGLMNGLREKGLESHWYHCPVYGGGWMSRLYVGSGVSYNHPDLIAAYKTARQARFEYGETPRVRGVNEHTTISET